MKSLIIFQLFLMTMNDEIEVMNLKENESTSNVANDNDDGDILISI